MAHSIEGHPRIAIVRVGAILPALWIRQLRFDHRPERILKRLIDLLLVLAAAPFALILVGIAAVVVRLDSPGPALFRQRRVGLGEQPFTLVKLRTMTIDMDDRPSHEASRAHITRSGRLFRRLKIDELPQLWNVLTGTMSLVGPRPCLPSQAELIAARRASGAFAVRPGITGPAQIAGVDMSTPDTLARIDGHYARQHSISGDLRLIVQTALGGGQDDAVRTSAGPDKPA
jgi:lipopolysaccharide/colanic/teichoic acid biosynthesis glycosyltransferase